MGWDEIAKFIFSSSKATNMSEAFKHFCYLFLILLTLVGLVGGEGSGAVTCSSHYANALGHTKLISVSM